MSALEATPGPVEAMGGRVDRIGRSDALALRADAMKAETIGLHRVGRLEDRQGGPEADARRNVGTGDLLPESRHRVGDQ